MRLEYPPLNNGGTVSGPLVIGTDPGGSELLRVGGAARVGGQLVVTGAVSLNNDQAIYAGGSAAANLRCYFDSANSYWRAPSGGHVWQSETGTNRMTLIGGALTLGTDPGGSELLRVGGTARFSGKITTVSAVPASFADLAAVQTWLAAQFT